MKDFHVTIPVRATGMEQAAQVMLLILGADEHSINDIGGLRIAEVRPDPLFLVCINCGGAFDGTTSAYEHGTADLSGSAGWCGDEGFNILPESEAM